MYIYIYICIYIYIYVYIYMYIYICIYIYMLQDESAIVVPGRSSQLALVFLVRDQISCVLQGFYVLLEFRRAKRTNF